MKKNIKIIIEIIATCFYVGKIKIMPGTFGSLLAFLFLPFISTNIVTLLLILLFFIIGIFASEKYSIMYKKDDPKEVVIDEFVAQLLVFYLVKMLIDNIYFFILSFALFRFFDITKPFPISFIDKNIKGGFGIMLDDFLAAIFAIISVFLIFMCYHSFSIN